MPDLRCELVRAVVAAFRWRDMALSSRDDLAQDAWVGLLGPGRGGYGEAKRGVIDGLRHRHGRVGSHRQAAEHYYFDAPDHYPDQIEEPSVQPEADTLTDARKVWREIARLPDRQRQLMELRYGLGLSWYEVMAEMRLSEGGVHWVHNRALFRLRRVLKVPPPG